MPEPSQAVTAPPNLQPFFDDMADSKTQSSLSSLKVTPARPAPLSANVSFHSVTFFFNTHNNFFSLRFLFSFKPGRKNKCVCLMTVTHSSLRPPLNPTPPHLFNAPKYVHQHVSVPIFSLFLLYSISILLSLCLMLVLPFCQLNCKINLGCGSRAEFLCDSNS